MKLRNIFKSFSDEALREHQHAVWRADAFAEQRIEEFNTTVDGWIDRYRAAAKESPVETKIIPLELPAEMDGSYLRSSAAYKKLHRICEDKNVRVKFESAIDFSVFPPKKMNVICIDTERPYSQSPDRPKQAATMALQFQ